MLPSGTTFASACCLRPRDRRKTSKACTQGARTFRILEVVILPIVVKTGVSAEFVCARDEQYKITTGHFHFPPPER